MKGCIICKKNWNRKKINLKQFGNIEGFKHFEGLKLKSIYITLYL